MLVRSAASPINPSDLLMIRGGFDATRVAQVVLLTEGAMGPRISAEGKSHGEVLISTGAEELSIDYASTKPVGTSARVQVRAAAAVI